MRHSLPIAPQFYVTAPQPCPYLAGQMERKLFTSLQGDGAERLNDALSKQGFRRSQNVLYRPSCAECSACLSARIRVADFRPNRAQRKVMQRNAFLRRRPTSPWATEAQFALFRAYLDSRHASGGMADMDLFEFASMIEETPVRSRLIEYSDPAAAQHEDQGLRAGCLTDILDDGVSMVYSFFDTTLRRNSLGTYVILDHVAIARDLGLQYVYLGYWVPGSPKMGYKAQFDALEVYRGGQWQHVTDPATFGVEENKRPVEPIAEQVARISLPQARQANPKSVG